jgi:thioredoxin reductase (NADPH)
MQEYDVIVIGAGPAGLTATSYASRSNLKVLVLDKGIYGGQMNDTAEIENYTGFNSVLGADLSEKMYQSSMQFGAEYLYGKVIEVINEGKYKIIKTDIGDFKALVVVIASGATHARLDVDGEEKYAGRGVSYCAVCDGSFFKDENIVVVGGGDSAIEEAVYLSNLVKKVTIIHRRDKLKATSLLQERAFSNPKIEFNWNKVVKKITGDSNKVTAVILEDTKKGTETEIKTKGTFIYVGIKANTQGLDKLKITNSEGFIKTNSNMETSIPGIFAVGDVRENSIRQIASAVGDGSIAGKLLFEYIQGIV